jgi:uncharacterized membrane protein
MSVAGRASAAMSIWESVEAHPTHSNDTTAWACHTPAVAQPFGLWDVWPEPCLNPASDTITRELTRSAQHSPVLDAGRFRKGAEMAPSPFILIANQYDSEADALADYDDVQQLYVDLGAGDDYDAAVIARRADGKVEIVKTTEAPTRDWAEKGLVGGLAFGALTALFPAVALGAGLLVGGGVGAALGAITGHTVGGVSSDLETLGELLEKGTSGLVVVAATDLETRVSGAITRPKRQVKADLDREALRKEIEARRAAMGTEASGT